ncbi:hypothetical protein F1880_009969 [Penicillium rolfsii]|nr:hypothetical protein F1880_009969 [Penicillium rolfsii]
MHFSIPVSIEIALFASRIHASAIACPSGHAGKALYLQTNEQQNSLISIPIGKDGMLYGGISTPTGGQGGDSINGMTNMPAGPDALSSQGSVFTIDGFFFAVNAGSNTLSMFKVNKFDPTKVTMTGEPVKIPGEFPVTVTASTKRRTVCVGYTGAKAGVSCTQFTADGLQRMEEVLHLNLNQTTPPVGPTNTVAQVFFAADDTRLITTVKGDPSSGRTGFVSVLPFKDPISSIFQNHDIRTSPPGTAVLFGGVEIPGTSNLLVTDASFGATILELNDITNEISLKQKIVIENQKATCWAAYSRARESIFVTDAALNRLVEVSKDGSTTVKIVDLKNGDPGLVDLQIVDRFVYALSPGNGTTVAAITVFDTFQGRQIQHYELGMLGVGQRSQGLAVF